MATKRSKASTSAKTAPNSEGQAPSFELAIARLGEIVDSLETGDLPLEESLALFEEGVQLVQASGIQLATAEKRVEKLLAYDQSGEPVVEELESEL